MFVLLEEEGSKRGGWNYVSTAGGGRYVELSGITVTLVWSAGSWASSQRQPVREVDREREMMGREE